MRARRGDGGGSGEAGRRGEEKGGGLWAYNQKHPFVI